MSITFHTKSYHVLITGWLGLGILYGIQQLVLSVTTKYHCNLVSATFGQFHNFILWGTASVVLLRLYKKHQSNPNEVIKKVLLLLGILFLGHLIINYVLYCVTCPTISLAEATADYQNRYAFGWFFFQAIIYSAIAFLCFPYLKESLQKVFSRPSSSPGFLTEIVIKEHRAILIIPTVEILWITANDYYVNIQYRGKSHLYRESLTKLEKILDPGQFIRIHRSTIVHVSRIETVKYSSGDQAWILGTKDGRSFKISRSKKDEVLKRWHGANHQRFN